MPPLAGSLEADGRFLLGQCRRPAGSHFPVGSRAYHCSACHCRRVCGWEIEHTGDAVARSRFCRSNMVAPPPLPSMEEEPGSSLVATCSRGGGTSWRIPRRGV
ncbi:uncharacterized protein LOC112271928 isoform X1 [Brachypodium distachyon]|uniref:uncharacterized protein LOC112271928 isoform X1 n=1 Tax=Brachypodium distachyon TaxID=15368 RepID=UPI000D0DA138|nr:uncharacterized protein LOC112271928 isoform X1 [Brachypodium distachyon]|eukprot:XP_024317957.1 uncharacterized protein LOC112271928 isoform X1 [Brachypodium distachyon]